MTERLIKARPSPRTLASRTLLRQFGMHPEDPEAVTLDMRGTHAFRVATNHSVLDVFANHFVADGDLITGQNQNAGPMVARLMMQRVLAKRAA